MTASGKKAQRSCLGCRQVQDQDNLVRYVLSPQGEVLVDYRKRLPGRGAYTCFDPQCVLTAIKRRQFERALKCVGDSPDGQALVNSLASQVRERVLNLVGMARKSSNVVTGSTLVLSTLMKGGGLALILLAEDISDAIGQKVLDKADVCGIPCYRLAKKGELGHLMGKGERSVIALKTGPLAKSLEVELLRYKYIVGES